MNKTGFIVHGRRSIVNRFNKQFDRFGKLLEGEYNVVLTSESGHAKALARELANDSYTHVVGVGGDGTLHEVTNGVMLSDNTNCIVGLLPFGTANDYAKSIGSKNELIDLINKINKGETKRVNLGRVSLASGKVEYFINIADLGLGVDVVQRVDRSGKLLGSSLTFSKAIIQSFLTYKNQYISVKADNWTWEGKINSFIVASGKYFGSGMCIAPDANFYADEFSIVIIGDVTLRDYIRYLGQIKRGKRIDHPAVQYKRAGVLTIDSKFGIEADGEFIGLEPTTIKLLKKKLVFLA
ncbi:MAG: diacylglycerol kinase family protein [Bacteroidota bacterium]